VAYGVAELMVKVRCERIVPVQGGVADLFKKTSIVVTRVIEVAHLRSSPSLPMGPIDATTLQDAPPILENMQPSVFDILQLLRVATACRKREHSSQFKFAGVVMSAMHRPIPHLPKCLNLGI